MSDPTREREHREEHSDGWHWWRCVPVIDAALATTPAPLDVERLRRAINTVNDMDPLDYLDYGDTTDAIAREYAKP